MNALLAAMQIAQAAVGEVVSALAPSLGVDLNEFRKTNHGANPWTFEALMNVSALAPHMEAARAEVSGTRTSCYRSPAVNKAAGGVPTSNHLTGKANDIVPTGPADLDAAAKKLQASAALGKLGPLKQIIIERGNTGRGGTGGRLHLDWDPGFSGTPRIIEDERF